METIIFKKNLELKRTKEELEEKLKVKIEIEGKKATISGESLDEYEASIVLDAMAFGFSAQKALSLKDPGVLFRKIHIKDFTRKKNLREVKARIIGTNGQTLDTLEEISNCDVLLRENEVGIIGSAESIESAITAITNLIRGTKQANVYRYLEKSNKTKKSLDNSLGLLNPKIKNKPELKRQNRNKE